MSIDEAMEKAVEYQAENDAGIFGAHECGWSHKGIFRNGFGAGYKAAQSAGEWVYVKDALPDDDGFYEVSTTATNHEDYSSQIPYVSGCIFVEGVFVDEYVYAWRKQREPAPYKEPEAV